MTHGFNELKQKRYFLLGHGVDFTLVKGDWRVGLEDEGDGEYYNYYRRSSLKFDNWGEACMEGWLLYEKT